MAQVVNRPLFDAEEFGRQVAEVLSSRRLTIRDAAKQIDINKTTLHRVTQGKAPDIETYMRIVKWLKTA